MQQGVHCPDGRVELGLVCAARAGACQGNRSANFWWVERRVLVQNGQGAPLFPDLASDNLSQQLAP